MVLTVFFALSLMMAQNSFAGSTPSFSSELSRTAGNQTGASCAAQPGSVGLFILLGLGAAYGGKKMYNYRKSLLKEQGVGITGEE